MPSPQVDVLGADVLAAAQRFNDGVVILLSLGSLNSRTGLLA